MLSRLSQFHPALSLAILLSLPFPLPAQQTDFAKQQFDWRAQHAADLQKPDGWLSLIGLEWIEPGQTSVGAAPDNKIHLPAGSPAHLAILKLDNEVITILPPSEGFPAGLEVDGAPAKEQTLRAEPNRDKLSSHITIGTLNLYPIRRADKVALRMKNANSPARVGFHGLQWFDSDPSFRVTAKWVPYEPQKTISLVTMIGTSYQQPVPGYAEFTLKGKTFRLEPVLEDPKVSKLFFILKDTTSTESTYPACRFLYTTWPDHGLDRPGELVLDFNHLENPPCAYTAFATCPLPPPGNRLAIALPVGEKRYHE